MVTNQEDANVLLVANLSEQLKDSLLNDGIKSGGGFVRYNEIRFQCEDTCNGEPLRLPA